MREAVAQGCTNAEDEQVDVTIQVHVAAKYLKCRMRALREGSRRQNGERAAAIVDVDLSVGAVGANEATEGIQVAVAIKVHQRVRNELRLRHVGTGVA